MRYTRYNYKKSKNNDLFRFILKLVGTVVGAGICGITLAYVAFSILTKNNELPAGNRGKETSIEANSNEIANSEGGSSTAISNTYVFYTVQCGYFSNESNANHILNSISGKYSAFIYEDEDKFRVLSGVYESDKVEYQIASICDGYIRLLDTAVSDDVKSINTDDFKGWTNELENISEGEKIDILNNLKEHIANLKTEINKANVPKEMEYIYTIL